MRDLPPDLVQKLEEGVTTLARAWRLTRADGLVVALTQHDHNLAFDGTVFHASPGLGSSDHDAEASLSPDRAALSGALQSDIVSQTDLLLGRWDGARVEAFLVDWANPSDFVAHWQGTIAGANWRGHAFELDVVGPEAALNKELGRVYARTCDARLGDARCKVDMTQAGRLFGATIAAIVSDRALTIAVPIERDTSDFALGRCKIQSGVALGWHVDIRDIASFATTWRITLAQPFPVVPGIGDTLILEMGCDKIFATCKARFANALNFRGQPLMPGDDVAFGGPAGSGNDGGKR